VARLRAGINESVDVKTHSSALPQLLVVALSLVGATTHAADIGHARLLSAAGQPLRLVVPVTALTVDEAATLSARAADPSAWQQHRLTPPVALDALRVDIAPGLRADARNLVISAAQPPQGAVVDMLLDLASASGQRRVQVSVLVAPSTAQPAADITLPRTGAAAVSVQHGNVLWRIASQHQYADATIYQMLAAFYQTNRPAFLRNNMNWLRAGATLTVPDAATVRAIDPLAARRLFLAHQDAFFRARAARAGAVITVAVTGQAAAPPMAPPEYTPTSDATGDRVRLSGATPFALPDQSADEEVARQRAQRDAALRVAQLERNISDLNQALLASANTVDAVDENGGARPAARLNANGTNADAATMAMQAAPPASARSLVADATTERRSSATTTVVGAANAAAVITDATTDAARIPGIDAAQRDTQRAAPPASALDKASPQGMATRPASAQGADALTTADSATDNTPTSAHTGSADTAVNLSGAVAAAAATADTAHTDAHTNAAPAAQSPGGVAVGAAASATIAPATTTDTTQANQTANVQAGTTAPSPASSPAIRPPDTQTPAHWSHNIWVWAAALGAACLIVLTWLIRRNPRRHKTLPPLPVNADDLSDDDVPSTAHEAILREQFAQRLKTIDLNLDDAPADGAGASKVQQTPER